MAKAIGVKKIKGCIPTIEEIERFILESGSDNVSYFGGKFEGGVHCQQVPDEFAACIHELLNTNGYIVKDYIEIGVASGGTTFIMNHFFHPDNIVLVDNNLHWKAPLRAWILKDIKRKEIIGNSTHYDIINQASGSYDLAIIDGDHTYDGVKADTENYIPFIRDGGFIIYHDSVLDDWGIKQLVNELKTDRRVEFIHEFVSTKRAPLGLALFKKVAA